MKNDYTKTVHACFMSYIVQAIINNFVPLLFLTFQAEYGISLSRITMLVTVNFGVQLLVDFLSAGFIDRIGYRASILTAHVLCALGLISLTVLPGVMPQSWMGFLGAVVVYAVGGGLLEVLVSPIVEACPTDNKEKAMSMLHSFYCWGHVGVVLLSTLFFSLFGLGSWKLLALFWALIPVANIFMFIKVPIAPLIEGADGLTLKALTGKKLFWVFMLFMVCAGASEQAVSQRAFVHRFLFFDFPVPLSGIGTCRLRPMRVFRGDHVAGNFQSGFRIHPGRRYGHVCISGPGR